MGVRAKTSFNQRGVSKMDEERRKKIVERWAKVDPSKIRVVRPPDDPLETFLSLSGI